MSSNYELTGFTVNQYSEISNISGWSGYINRFDALDEYVKRARLYKRLSRGGDNKHMTHVLNEDTKELEYVTINEKSSLRKFIAILICEYHCLTKQQIKKYLAENNF